MIKENFIKLYENSFRENWDLPCYTDYGGDTQYTYGEVAEKIARLHLLFKHCSLRRGDKISVIGKNNAHWCIAYMATITYGAIIVPILQDFTPNDVHHIVNHSESVFLFTSDSIWDNLEEEKLAGLRGVFSLTDFRCLYQRDGETIQKFLKNTDKEMHALYPKGFTREDVQYTTLSNDKVMLLNYTSGTTGFSKGVMLTGNNLAGNVTFGIRTELLKKGDKVLSFLPLAHPYGCPFDFLTATAVGTHVTLLGKTPSPKIIMKAFEEVKPNLIITVPLVIEKIYKNIIQPLINKKGMKWALNIPLLDTQIYNQKTIEWIGSKLPKTEGETEGEGGKVKNEWILDANKDDVYLFAFRALNWGANGTNDAVSIYSVKIEEMAEGKPEAPVALPYEVSFEKEESVSGWTAMDRSASTASTWSWNSWGYQEYGADWNPVGDQHPCVGFSSDFNTDANDYWVSPAFALEAGKTYVAKAHTANNRSCVESGTTSFTMKLGTNRKVQGSFDKTLGSIELNTVYDRDPSTFEFSVEKAGNYYVAFHISDKTGANAYGYIFDFSLAEKKAVVEEPVATEPVANLAAAELTAEKSVELTWTNPTKDVDGKDLPADALLTVKVYEGEEVVKVFEDQAPGSEGKHVQAYTDETFAGEHNYKVVVVYKDKESEAATTSLTVKVVVDAINGVMVPADAKVSVHTLSGVAVGNNLSTLGKGTYIVRVKTADGAVKTMKIAK